MTGHQDHPGTGRTLMGKPTAEASIEKIAEACGVKRIRVVNPYDLKQVDDVLKDSLAADEMTLIISRAPCILKERRQLGPVQDAEIHRLLCHRVEIRRLASGEHGDGRCIIRLARLVGEQLAGRC